MPKKYLSFAKKILKLIKKSKRILVNIHRSPDLDSLGSALALKRAIESKFEKEVVVVCPSAVSSKYEFLPSFKKIKTKVDFSSFDFSKFDLFIILDSSSFDMVVDQAKISFPKIPTIVIDHHQKNTIPATLKLVDKKASAVGEILFFLFKIWRIKIDREIATFLFVSLYSDTVELKYCRRPKIVFSVIKELVDRDAKVDLFVRNFYQRYSIFDLKIIGEFIKNLNFDKKEKIGWTMVDFETYKKLNYPIDGKEFFADNLLQNFREAEVGILFLEEQKNLWRVSFRSKGNFDVSKLAQSLGGGGHPMASGCTLRGKPEEVKKRVISTFKMLSKKKS